MKSLWMPGRLVVISTMSMMACGHARSGSAPTTPPPKVQLTVIPAESDAFPRAARAVSASLAAAKVSGIDEARVSKVSLEVVQLSVECVDPTSACYEAIGRSMAANQLLFARIEVGGNKRQLKITVTLFDVDANVEKQTAAKVFATEAAAVAGVAALVAEVTR